MVSTGGKSRPHWVKSALVNGLGATVTGITTGVVLVRVRRRRLDYAAFRSIHDWMLRACARHYHAVNCYQFKDP